MSRQSGKDAGGSSSAARRLYAPATGNFGQDLSGTICLPHSRNLPQLGYMASLPFAERLPVNYFWFELARRVRARHRLPQSKLDRDRAGVTHEWI